MQIELLYMLISLDKLTEEIDLIFWFTWIFKWKFIIQKFRTHTTLQGISPIAKIAIAIAISIFIKFGIAIAISIAIWKWIADRDRNLSFAIVDLLGDPF